VHEAAIDLTLAGLWGGLCTDLLRADSVTDSVIHHALSYWLWRTLTHSQSGAAHATSSADVTRLRTCTRELLQLW